jgi:hypothetical protein
MAKAHCSKTGETHAAIAALAFPRPVDEATVPEPSAVALGDNAALKSTSFASAWTLR